MKLNYIVKPFYTDADKNLIYMTVTIHTFRSLLLANFFAKVGEFSSAGSLIFMPSSLESISLISPINFFSIALKAAMYLSLNCAAFFPVKLMATKVKPSRSIQYMGCFLPLLSV